MDERTLRLPRLPEERQSERREDAGRYQSPTIEVIALDCEISAYAPDEDDRPLF
jgi:hypothetical protein